MFGKRNVTAFLAALLLLLGLALPARAADAYPVSIAGAAEALNAVNRDGVTYLPLRQLFESCGATVQWDAATRTITSRRLDGAELKLDMRQNTAELTAQGQTAKLAMPQKGYISAGVTYLPLRFVAESLGCVVEWKRDWIRIFPGLVKISDAAGQVYVLDQLNGRFYRGCYQQAEYIGESGFAWEQIAAHWQGEMFSPPQWQLDRTPGGYMLWAKYPTDGAILHDCDFTSYLNAATGKYYCCYYRDDWPGFLTADGTIWLETNADEEWRIWQIDDASGAVRRSFNSEELCRGYAPDISFNDFCFADDEWILLRYHQGDAYFCRQPLLYNYRTGEYVDLLPKLLPADQIEKFKFNALDQVDAMNFDHAAEGKLYFTYVQFRDEQTLVYQYRD